MKVKNQTEKQKLGMFGENLAKVFLKKIGLCVIETNFRTNFGEADIIAIDKSKNIHIVEVKTVSRKTSYIINKNVSHETDRSKNSEEEVGFNQKSYKVTKTQTFLRETYLFVPQTKFTQKKIKRMANIAEVYIEQKKPNIKDIKLSAIFVLCPLEKSFKTELIFIENINCWLKDTNLKQILI